MNEKDIIIQVNQGFRRYLFWINIIFIPLGAMGGFAFCLFLNDKSADRGDIIGAGGTAFCALIMLGFWIYYKRKKIHINDERILVRGVFKQKYYTIKDISRAEIRERRICFYDHQDHEIIRITSLYNGLKKVEKWVLDKGIAVKDMVRENDTKV